MKDHKYTQCILCEGKDLAESVKIFNEEMKKNGIKDPKFERVGDKFLMYVTVTEREPESLAEEMELKGHCHKCIECSHCEREKNKSGNYDARKKKAMCNRKGKKVFINDDVCSIFYEEKQDGRSHEQIRNEMTLLRTDKKGA